MLAAGAGTRLRPLTWLRPKALCPVDNVPLVDLAIGQARAVTTSVAVNCHHGRELMEAHLAGRVHLSVEEPEALGTAGALGALRDWIDERPVLVLNADACAELLQLAEAARAPVVTTLMAKGAFPETHELFFGWPGMHGPKWSNWAMNKCDLLVAVGARFVHDGPFFDCGTPADYLAANLASSRGRSVVGKGAVVEGSLDESVVWPGAVVRRHEHLRRAIRAGEHLTVFVR